MTTDQAMALAKRVVSMTRGEDVSVSIRHTARVVTRMANGQVLTGDDGDDLMIRLVTSFGERSMHVSINQLDDTALRAMVERCEAIARARIGQTERIYPDSRPTQDTFLPVKLWHDATVEAMTTTRESVIPDVLDVVQRAQLRGAGFLGFMARVEVSVSNALIGVSEETDSELSITARSSDGMSSGWAGQAARDWTRVRPDAVAAHAVEFAQRSANPVAVEPGRRTAILSSVALVQILRYLGEQFDAFSTDNGNTGFSRQPRGNKRGLRMFDTRLNMLSDPADPDGGYPSNFAGGYATPRMTWIENGVLKNLAYSPRYGMERGKTYAATPYSIRLSGGTTSMDEMIAQCREGIYVNRFSGVELIEPKTCLVSGVTRDGCFLVKDGKIVKAAKNFRFLDSPFAFLNNIEALGVPERAAFGYTPPGMRERNSPHTWPRPPIIVPPMMVRDFNFVGIADAI